MTQKDMNLEPKLLMFWQPVGIMIAILALIVTTIGTFFQVRARELKAELQILSADRLTQTRDIPELEANFKFKGNPTKELWKLKVQFLNSVKVFQPQKEFSNFPHSLQVVKDSNNQFILKFIQWRSTEQAVYSFYISSDLQRKVPPIPIFPKRDIINGNLLVRNLSLLSSHKKPLIDKLPKPIAFTGRILGIAGVLLVTGALIFATFDMAKDSFPWLRWRHRYYNKFRSYVEHIDIEKYVIEYSMDSKSPSEINELKQKIIATPWRLFYISDKKNFWEGFAGPECPSEWPQWNNWGTVILWLGVLSISICASCALLASVIIT
jgi:hypothetical protein